MDAWPQRPGEIKEEPRLKRIISQIEAEGYAPTEQADEPALPRILAAA